MSRTVAAGGSAWWQPLAFAGLAPDLHAPFRGATSHLLAALAATPGVVGAVGSDGHVWRRAQDGRWATASVLLPAGGVSSVRVVAAPAAFTQPLSTAAHLGTDGYGVLLTTDGGDDWIRADVGIGENVLSVATDSSSHSLYAATSDALWVHRLQSFPAPPAYHDAALYLHWLGIGAVGLVATVLAILALDVALPSRRRRA